MTIDLHGYSVDETTSCIINALFSFSLNKYEHVLKIICGKGQGIVELTVLNILDQEGYEYTKDKNEIIVYQKDEDFY